MREILFRGTRIDNGEWIEGAYYHQKKYYGEPHERHCIIASDEDFTYDLALDVESVDPATVGQYTGLTDKNGKKVFEHDIIQIRFEGDAEPPSTPPVWYETGHVFWHEQLLGWYVAFADDLDGIPIQEYEDHEDIFVIGNAFDNPELLEG